MSTVPERVHEYRNHHLDSTRWDHFNVRDGDIVVTTAYKAGTTWTQRILAALVLGLEPDRPRAQRDLAVGRRAVHGTDRADDRVARCADTPAFREEPPRGGWPSVLPGSEVRRGWPRHPRRVHVAVEPLRRVHRPRLLAVQRSRTSGRRVPTLSRATAVDLWPRWIGEGWFEWEPDGWPFWSHHHHLSTWWQWRDLPNVYFIHFGDLLADTEGEMRRLAFYCEIDVPEERWPAIVDAVQLDAMRTGRQERRRRRLDDLRRWYRPVSLQGHERTVERSSFRRRSRSLRTSREDSRPRIARPGSNVAGSPRPSSTHVAAAR